MKPKQLLYSIAMALSSTSMISRWPRAKLRLEQWSPMTWIYDEIADSATLCLVDRPAVDHSDAADIDFDSGAIVVHMDVDNRVVGIELLGVGNVAPPSLLDEIRASGTPG